MEEAEERHQVEIKVYKQKVKHLLYEHQNNLTEMKAEGTVVMKLAQKEHRTQEGVLRKDMRALKVELKEQELANEVVVKNLRLKHTEEITKMRNDFERQVREIEAKYDKKMKMLRDELDLRRKTELHEVEERKNSQINTLMQRHEEAFTDIKNYYNDITLNNLALINSLKVLRVAWAGETHSACPRMWAAESWGSRPQLSTPTPPILFIGLFDNALLISLIEIPK
uniref:Dynein regulatory complex subunit 4 n=1 Tax=Macaca fascicularis TaxID=9541 RepID=A0A7N9CRM4_MACFA